MKTSISLEVCVETVEAAIAAERGGANRIELCIALYEGGLTPSYALMQQTLKHVSIPVYMMIRPRGGDFFYSEIEFEIMKQDILQARALGAAGIVLGILKSDGTVDIGRTRQLVELARPMKVTFHRAFDSSADLMRSLEDIIQTGSDCILTSGGAAQITNGAEVAAVLLQKAAGRIEIMIGGGVKASNARQLFEQTGVSNFHASLRTPVPSPMEFRKTEMRVGAETERDYIRFTVKEGSVRELVGLLQDALCSVAVK
ncbi:MAG: copper homeostasis protein CutC [Acidobacteriaceae bacterium]